VRTVRLLAVAYPALALLALRPGPPGLFPVIGLVSLLVALLSVGELWLRAVIGELVIPVARIGFGAAAGLVSLPLVAIVLHVLGVPIGARPLAVGLALLATGLGRIALIRGRSVPARPYRSGTCAAVAIPVVLGLLVAGGAVAVYRRLPHPAAPGYTSVALNGWAAAVDGPVLIPAGGVDVPVRVSSAGLPAATAGLRVRVGDLASGPARPLAIAADTTRSVDVHVPAPPNGCLHRIEISVGAVGTVFYGRGPGRC
jgi:hypothetical protein